MCSYQLIPHMLNLPIVSAFFVQLLQMKLNKIISTFRVCGMYEEKIVYVFCVSLTQKKVSVRGYFTIQWI